MLRSFINVFYDKYDKYLIILKVTKYIIRGEMMKKYLPSIIVFFVFGFIGQILVGNWGLLIAVVIGTLYLIYNELTIITSLLKERSSMKKEA